VDLLPPDDVLPRTADIGRVLKHLRSHYPQLAILILSYHLNVGYIQKIIRHDADGFIYKEDRLEESLPLGIEIVRRGELFLSPKASALPYAGKQQANLGHLNSRDMDGAALDAKRTDGAGNRRRVRHQRPRGVSLSQQTARRAGSPHQRINCGRGSCARAAHLDNEYSSPFR
jgi:hypothetical protein